MFTVYLTDGKNSITAIENRFIPDLKEDLLPGTKVIFIHELRIFFSTKQKLISNLDTNFTHYNLNEPLNFEPRPHTTIIINF